MKKVDNMIRSVDNYVDGFAGPIKIFIKRYFTVFSSILLFLFAAVFLFRLVNNKPYFMASVINEDIARLSRIFYQIDETCNILNISQNRCSIDFLTVKNFITSEIGGLNLAFPDRWEGPYLASNPRFQEKHYELVSIDEGLFIVPGDNVKLPTGYVMGKDIVVSRTTPIKKLISPGGMLNYKGQALGAHLTFKIGDWDSRSIKKKTIDKASKMLKEFNEAMSFTKNEV